MISLFFFGFLLLTFFWNLYYTKHWSASLCTTLDFLQDFVYAGESAEMTERIENRKKMALPVVEVGFHMDKKLSFRDCENTNVSDFIYKRDIFALLGSQRITRTLTLDCPKRGYYRIDSADLTTFSMLHRQRFSIQYPVDTELYVYARRTNISDILVACERLMGSLQCARRLYEDPFAFSSIREYTVTDPMNTINWKASARTGELMVNTFESTLTQQVMLYLDVEDSGILKYDFLVEESVSVAACLSQKLIEKGMEVGICINTGTTAAYSPKSGNADTAAAYSPKPDDTNAAAIDCSLLSCATCLDPAGGKKQLTKMERMLAKYQANDKVTPLAKILSHSACPSPPEDAVIIFISKNAAINQKAIETFAGRDKQAIWVLPYARNEECSVKTSESIHLIKREVTDY